MSIKYGEPGGSARLVADVLRREATRLDAQATNWERAALGEVATAEALKDLPAEYVVLNDLRVPDSDSNVDHVVVGPTGVWVVETKEWDCRIVERGGTLWRGATSLRDELQTATWLARTVRDVSERNARAVICVGAPPLPSPQQEVDKVLVVTRSALATSITGAPVTLSAKQIDKAVNRLQSNMGRSESSDVTSIDTKTASRRPRRSAFGPIVRLTAVAAAAIVVFPLAVRLLDRPAQDPAAGSTDRVRSRPQVTPGTAVADPGVSPTTSSAPSTVAVAVPTMPPDAVLAATVSCPGPGQGWTISWEWPGPTLPDGQAYLFEWSTGDAWVRSGSTSAPDDGGAVALANVAPGASYPVRLSVVEGVPERSSPYVESAVAAPNDSC